MLLPNKKQETRLFEFAGAARFAYNWALDKEMQAFEQKKGFISAYDLRKEFTQVRHAKDTNWLEGISNNVTKQAIKDCADAYQRFFKLQKETGIKYTKKRLAHLARIGKKPTVYDRYGHPKFRSRKNGCYRFYQDVAKIRFSGTHVKLEALTDSRRKNRQSLNWVRLAERDRIPQDAKYMNPRVSYDGEHWWISVTIEQEISEPTGVYGEGVVIDLGIKNLAVCSDGLAYKNINKTAKIRRIKKEKRRLQRRISRAYGMANPMKEKGVRYKKTCNLIRAEKRLLRLNHRLTNLRQNYTHQITSEIIGRKPSLICLEDLNVQGMMKNKHLAEKVQEENFYEFRRQIEYKAARAGIPVVIADRFYPSSKTCSHCGHVKKDLKLKDRTYICPVCGNQIDRDLQAAINLRAYGENDIEQKFAG